MDDTNKSEYPTLYGAQKQCPACGAFNKSGLILPGECQWCEGTGEIDLGLDWEELMNQLPPDRSDPNNK